MSKAKPEAFDAWVIFRKDGKPSLSRLGSHVSIGAMNTRLKDAREAAIGGDLTRPDGAPHKAVRCRIVPVPAKKKRKAKR